MLKLEVPSSGLKLNTKSKFCAHKFAFFPDAITILVGPNGGGKTTLLKAILSPSEAGISLLSEDQDLSTASPLVRSAIISYVGTASGGRPRISVRDFLTFSFFKKGQLGYEHKIQKMLLELGISYLEYSRIDQLSEGEYKRIHIASGLLQDAKWYLLDEPEEHLDPEALKRLVKIILRMKTEGKSFILACHNLSFASYMADYFIGINACAEIVFSESRKTVMQSKLLDELFLCEFLYDVAGNGVGTPSLLGPKYE